ncbi:MAG: MgtC/SapB family protein [Candidatus Omnitrophica bacterium]|nr:MgtC/SapB family protein [Candidatus Omnitrophota bacterium]
MIANLDMFYRLVLAVILGGLVGLERESHRRAAGLRTHILVCLGATLIMMTSMYIFDIYHERTNLDPARLAAQVVSGIGFLGAGTIIRYRASIRGLTTAASLWVVAGVGLAIGCGFIIGAIWTTLLSLAALFFLRKIEMPFLERGGHRSLVVEVIDTVSSFGKIRQTLNKHNARVKNMRITKKAEGKATIEIDLKLFTDEDDKKIIDEILRLEGITQASWSEIEIEPA